jgi:predicted RNA-binding protein with PUA-like domain
MEKGDWLMAHWLFKSEPDAISFQSLVDKLPADEEWHGIRNYGARNNMRLMTLGERAFFYHSNIGKEIVGVVEVTRLSAPESQGTDPRWDCVHFRPVARLTTPIGLERCKHVPGLEKMVLINNSRLSVQPVSDEEWQIICDLGGVVDL